MKISSLVNSDKWATFALSVPRPGGDLLVSVGLDACLRLIGAWQEMNIFIGKGRVGGAASHRRC
jgi:hypothetical protein